MPFLSPARSNCKPSFIFFAAKEIMKRPIGPHLQRFIDKKALFIVFDTL